MDRRNNIGLFRQAVTIRRISVIWLIIIIFIAKELAFVGMIGPVQGPDEFAHYRYVQTLFYEQKLPILGRSLMRNYVEYEPNADEPKELTMTITGHLRSVPGYQINYITQHPPLYYLVLLPVYALFQNQNIIIIMMILRLVSVLMAAASLYFIFKTIQKLLPQNRILQTVITCAIAFLPTFSFISAMINNDNLEILLSTILVYLLIKKSVLHKTDIKWDIKTGVVLAMLALTKMTALPLFFVVLIVQVFDFFSTKESAKRKSVIYSTIIIFVIPSMLAGWWYLRNFILFGAFFVTLKEVVAVNPETIKLYPMMLSGFPEIDPTATMKIGLVNFLIKIKFTVEYYKMIWEEFCGRTLLTSWQNVGIHAFAVIGIIGQIKNIFMIRIANVNPLTRLRNFLASGQGALFFTFAILLSFVIWKIYEICSLRGFLGAMQGRYILAAAPALFYFLIRGWEHLTGKKWFENTAITLMIMFILNDAISFIYIIIPNFN